MDGTQAVGTLNTVARGDHVHPVDTTRAPLASPALTGTPTAPTAGVGTNTTQIATMASLQAEFSAREYTSTELIITNGGTVTLTHSLGKLPKTITVYLKCYVAEYGFSVGDTVFWNIATEPDGSNEGIGALVTTSQIVLRIGNGGIANTTLKSSGGAFIPTAANWKFFITATA